MYFYEPKVSIVIPAFNAANYLADAIDSALAQTYKNIEIIVVNDGSNDNGDTAKVAASYGGKIRYFEKENGGSSSAMNYGIQKMTGDWFSWLSHDDLYYPYKVEKEIEFLNSLNLDYNNIDEVQKHICVASADLIDGSGAIIRRFSKKNIELTNRKINSRDGNLRLIAEPIQAGFHGCSCLIHKKAFENVGMFDENLRLLNDMDLWFRFYSRDYQIHYLPMVLVKGRVHSKQVSRSIGFSYHNSEQDLFWIRNLEWLEHNCSNSYEYFYIYGKTAYKKTRYLEGKRAFKKAAEICPNKKAKLFICTIFYSLDSKIVNLVKRVYLRLKV